MTFLCWGGFLPWCHARKGCALNSHVNLAGRSHFML